MHLLARRGDRIYAEAVVTCGVVRIHCRECLRWHKITITKVKLDPVPEKLPESIAIHSSR